MVTAIDQSTDLASDQVKVGFDLGKLAKDGYFSDNLRVREIPSLPRSMAKIARTIHYLK